MTRRQGLIQTEHGVYGKDHIGAEATCVTVTRGDGCPPRVNGRRFYCSPVA